VLARQLDDAADRQRRGRLSKGGTPEGMVVWSIAIAVLVAHAHAAGAVGHIDQEDRYVRIGIHLRSDSTPG